MNATWNHHLSVWQKFTEEQFKEIIRSGCSYIKSGNFQIRLFFHWGSINLPLWKRSFYVEIITPTWNQLRKAIIKRSRLKNKANKSGKCADETAFKRNLVVKLNKEAKKSLRIYRPHACNFIKKETRSQVNFAKFLRTPFLQNTSGWLLLLHEKSNIVYYIWNTKKNYFHLRFFQNI